MTETPRTVCCVRCGHPFALLGGVETAAESDPPAAVLAAVPRQSRTVLRLRLHRVEAERVG